MKRQNETTRLQLVTHDVDLTSGNTPSSGQKGPATVLYNFISLIDLGREVLLGIRKDNLPSVSITSHQLSFQIVLLQKYFMFIEYS